MTNQDAAVLGANKNGDTSELAHYQELEQKYLDGSISPDEADELWRLEHLRGQSETPSEDEEISDAPVYDRYRELEHKFLSGSINEQEWSELLRLDDVREQSGVLREHVGNNVGSERLERYSKPAIIRKQNADLPNGLPIRGEAKTTVDKVDDGGIVLQRRIYGVNGMATKDFDTTDHNLPHAHPMGAHKHEFDYSKRKPRGEPLPLTEEELKEHGDIIRRGENYHD